MPVQTQHPGITFAVHDVEPQSKRLTQCRMFEHVKNMLQTDIESCSDYHSDVCWGLNYQPLLAAVYTSYSLHYPLVLSPDAVWLTIAQGVAHHMAVEGERLRQRFVAHEGRLELTFATADWVSGSPENPWADAFDSWTEQIAGHVGTELYDALMCDFSTTTPAARAASQVVMMDVFERYFRYVLVGICGVPEVTLRGGTDDWQRLADKLEMLEPFDMPWWLDHLRPIVGQFVATSKGDVDVAHWRNICKLEDAYGGHLINGWIAKLFPYLRAFVDGPCSRRNPIFETGEGFQTFVAPGGLSQVPFLWRDVPTQTERAMEAIGGLVGVKQDAESAALEPIAGWAVRRASELDVLMARVKNQHEVTPRTPVVADIEESAFGTNGRSGWGEVFADLAPFYHEFDEARLSFDGGFFVRILRQSEIQSMDWGEVPDEMVSRGPDGRTWYRFADLPDGQFLCINLDVNRHCSPGFKKLDETIGSRELIPICVCSEATRGVDGRNPVVALSFTELLTRLLDESSPAQPYWQSDDFAACADAEEFTRRESISFGAGLSKRSRAAAIRKTQ